ncbi:MAG: hypothetical protein KDC98_18315 [Planctomycetes bacterium]|nr:hypothetical protein [Planctomycetota bacterium]
MTRAAALAALVGLAACATPRWQDELLPALSDARAAGREVVVFFALAGRDASDRMQGWLDDPRVLAALGRGGFAAVTCDGFENKRLYQGWVGFGEGMGIAVLDGEGRVYATRPGPQDPPELAAYLDLCAASRAELRRLRAAAAAATADPNDKHRLGVLLLRLGNRVEAEPLLLDAALAGVTAARHHVARLYALEGSLEKAWHWLRHVPRTPAAETTRGYLLYKERRHEEAAQVLEAALQVGELGDDRQRALLFLGKALHEARRDDRAGPLLRALANENTGSTFEAAALHTLAHIADPDDGHTH